MQYHFKIQKEKNGYSAYCVELKGCMTQAVTREELDLHMQEALNLYLSESEDSTLIFKNPGKPKKGLVAVTVHPPVALAMTLRQARLKKNLTQRAMQHLLGIKHLSNYQRLEDPKRSNPEFKTLIHLIRILPELDLESVFRSYR